MDVNMGNVLGLVFANMHDTTLGDMTKNRTMGSVMFGGRYRLMILNTLESVLTSILVRA